MLYKIFEMNQAALVPMRAFADFGQIFFRNPLNPLSQTPLGKNYAAAFEVVERVTRRYEKPTFGISDIDSADGKVAVSQRTVWHRPFCNLLHFQKTLPAGASKQKRPKLLIVAPMSGHHATLLRGTVRTMLADHDVYITDWLDARQVPIGLGTFDLDDYIDYICNMLHVLGPDTHVMAVCQPSVPVLAAAALMSARGDPCTAKSLTLMGGPVDTRNNPTVVNTLAQERGTDWFRRNVIHKVPFPHAGVMRSVYPGFLQLTGFMTMNLDRHVDAHKDLFSHLIHGDGDSADKHKKFYDEYLSVMDLTAEFFIQTIDTVFVEHRLPEGTMTHRGTPVDLTKITCALMTVEGEMDDITGVGHTEAAHDLCANVPDKRRVHHLQGDVGHYGVFNGSKFRSSIAPRITEFIRKNGK
jgi:poly(3-hydroxybutyrate) depolymerase